MSTRSTIWIKNEDGTFSGVYCHFDGYLSGNGMTLKRYYKTADKVRELVALGSLSVLEENTEKCIAYHRDRGVDLCIYSDVEEKELPKYQEEYNYFFIDGKWKYTEAGEKEMKDLEKALSKIKKEEKE